MPFHGAIGEFINSSPKHLSYGKQSHVIVWYIIYTAYQVESFFSVHDFSVGGAWNHGVCGVNPRQPFNLVHTKNDSKQQNSLFNKESWKEGQGILWKDSISTPSRTPCLPILHVLFLSIQSLTQHYYTNYALSS